MTVEPHATTVVVDTNVFGANLLERTAPLAFLYQPLLRGRRVVLSFQTVAELEFGAVRRGWGAVRRAALSSRIAAVEVVHTTAGLVTSYARLRADCEAAGHGLGQRQHDADRWIAATALYLDVLLVSHDGVFRGAPGLRLETALDS